MKSNVAIVRGEEWEGLYLNGKLVREGHSLNVRDVLNDLDIDCRVIHADDQWLIEEGTLPPNLGDVKVT